MRALVTWLAGAALLAGATLLSRATLGAQVATPEHITVDGGPQLRLAGQARRTHLLGTVDLYTVAIYSNAGITREALASADTAKALRIGVMVTYTEDLQRRVGIDWRRELIPPLEPPAAAHLRGSFAGVRDGDVITVEYTPGKGTVVRVNKNVVVSAGHHDLMLAFLDHWLGDRPVSEAIKRTLLGSS